MNKLILAEKPSVAVRVAMSLGDSRPHTETINGVRYFIVQKGEDTLFITAAAGHLFTLTQTGPSKIPTFDIEWAPSYKVNKGAYFTKKYLDAIESVGQKCSFFINACDYDLEGTVIGTNIIKHIINKNVNSEISGSNVMRMRFSTTTNIDLLNAYENLNSYDSQNFDAGETRHRVDWMWGINLSRALMRALSSRGIHKTLSIGRVQGPALGILSRKEIDIKNFVSKPYWKVVATVRGINFDPKENEIYEKSAAEKAFDNVNSGIAEVKKVERLEKSGRPFPPFDLTSLQVEASRVFRIDPSRTLAIAQSLYEKSYISYPRTSSQKLPQTLNLPRIITSLSRSDDYAERASILVKGSRFRPAEGIKDDEAHPAVYPTGEIPKNLSEEERRIYDLITSRFLACFAEYSKSEYRHVMITIGDSEYSVSGSRTTYRGWLDFYRYYEPKEAQIPDFNVGEKIKPDKVELKSLKTLPPKRYTKASLISLLEDKDLGTKATRAEVIDTLFRRDYINGSSISVTEFGLSVYEALSSYCPDILDEDLTRKLEKDMEKIQKGEASKSEVISEGKEFITMITGKFAKNEADIGNALMKGLKESQNSDIMGQCKSGGNLILRRSKTGKNFIGCSDWPKCTITYSVPQSAKIVSTGKTCKLCNTPIIKVFRKGKRPFEMDLDPNCETKKDWANRKSEQDSTAESKPALQAEAVQVTKRSAAVKPIKKPKTSKPKESKKAAEKKKGR